MKEFNRLMEYREYYIYDCKNEVFCIAAGDSYDEAKELYSYFVDTYFQEEMARWEFEVALDCVHNFSDKDIRIIQEQGKIYRYHFGYGMYVRNHYVHGSEKHQFFMADGISSSIEKLIYTIVLPVYNCFSKEFMNLMNDYGFQDIQAQYEKTQPIIGQMLTVLAEPNNALAAKEALGIIRSTIKKNIGPDGFSNIAIPIALTHIEKYGHIKSEPVELCNALYSKTRLYNKEYNQLKAIIEMDVHVYTMEPHPRLRTIEATKRYIIENLGLSAEDALCMAKCAMAIGKKLREVLDRNRGD